MRVRLFIYVLLVLLMTALTSVPAQAFGISYQYLPNNTLDLYPGQNYLFKLTIQNKDESSAKVVVNLNSSIATLVGGPELRIPAKNFDTYVLFNFTVPEDAEIGDIFIIQYSVYPPVDEGNGQIPLVVAYNKDFNVKVVEKPPEPEKPPQPPVEKEKFKFPRWVVIPVVIILIIIILLLIWRKSRQMSDKIVRPKRKRPTEFQNVIIPKSRPEKKTEPAHKTQNYVKPVTTQEKTLKPSQYFHLKNGKSLKSLKDLALALPVMSPDVFSHHVNSQKNDFANWTSHSLGKYDLANKLTKKNTRQAMLELIKNELEKK